MLDPGKTALSCNTVAAHPSGAPRADDADALYDLGNSLKQRGALAEAAEHYRRALRHRPDHVQAQNNLGTTLRAMGRPERAEAALRRALRITTALPAPHNNLGLALLDQDRREEAAACFQAALTRAPDFVEAHANLALVHARDGDHAAAAAALRRALEVRPDDAALHERLAGELAALAQHAAAHDHYARALHHEPQRITALAGLAEMARRLGRPAEAERHCRAVLALRPDMAEAWQDLGGPLRELGRFDAAIDCYRQALARRPDFPEALSNLANVLADLGRDAEAEPLARRAIALRPDYADAHFNLATLCLRDGRFDEGWRALEWRLVCFAARHLPQPRWSGAPTGARVVLLHAEQGLGDTIQFARYATLAADRDRVVLEVQPSLVRLMRTLPGVEAVRATGEASGYELHCPLMSLPLALRDDANGIPDPGPYLQADPAARDAWRRRLAPHPGLRVGIAWAGNPEFPNDRRRSIPPAEFAALLKARDATFVSLQKGGADALRDMPGGAAVLDWTGELEDFADTAALVAALDLVVCVDTAVTHLAGALGVPVWLLNRFDTCWRWRRRGERSDWYGSLRQFRQQRPLDWDAPLAAVRAALAARTCG